MTFPRPYRIMTPVQARQMSYFLAVAEHGSFGRAASALGVAQPTLSQSVRTLERDLGTELFHREPHGVVLTTAGRALLGPARQLVRDLRSAREAVGGGGGGGGAVLDLVAVAPLGVHPGAALVASFCRAHPDVLVHLDRPDHDSALPTMVRDGSAELGLSYLPAPRLDLASVYLGRHDLVLAYPPTLRPPDGPVELSDLAGVTLIGPQRGSWQRDLVQGALRSAGVRTRLVAELGQRDATIDLVLAGVGVAFLVDVAAPAAAARGVTIRSLNPPLRLPFGLIHRQHRLSDPARAFAMHARASASTASASASASMEG